MKFDAAFGGAAGFLPAPPALAAEGPLETTTVRIAQQPGVCIAPQYVAEELLRAEDFTDVRYVDPAPRVALQAVGRGEADFVMNTVFGCLTAIDAGEEIALLAGVHVGCFELFGNDAIRGISDLKGKTVGVERLGGGQHLYVTLMAAHVGLDPVNDIRWVTSRSPTPVELFADGKIDACLGFPPEPQDLRARHIGHVVVSTTVDRPWSQYFCCMLGGNREYVRQYPNATKRVLRAVLKAADLCAADPASAARRLVDRGFTNRYDYALQTLSELPYDRWRDYDAEDTVRFYALRLHEAGLIK